MLEGEVRILSAQLTVEQIFNDRKAFKETIITNVQEELELFGLQIYNANIKELQDSPGSEYFSCACPERSVWCLSVSVCLHLLLSACI